MKASLKSYGITATIETESDDLTLTSVMEDVIIPLLIATGYQKENIDEYMDRPACDCGACKDD